MSHTILKNDNNIQTFNVTIVNYTNGGEPFTFADFGVTTFATSLAQINGGLLLGQVAPNQNSLAVALFPIWTGSAVKLLQFVSGVPTEIATTANLNATFAVLLYI